MSPQTSSVATRTPSNASGRTIVLLCAVAVLWLATRPYFGVIQDARFYMLEALRTLDPARYAGDLYFQFGSQGSFSLFSRLYLPLLPTLGVGATGMVLTATGQLLWLFGLFSLVRVLVGPQYRWLSVAVVIGMINIYAPYFGYGEAFATARLFAEALTMLALSWLPSRVPMSLALLATAAALHPLMALPGVATALVYLALRQPLWWAAMAASAALAAGLGLAGVQPFVNLFQTMDADWFAVVRLREIQCLIGEWPADTFIQVAGVLAWAIAALVLAAEQHRRFLVAVFVVGIGGVVCAFVGGDMLHNVFIIELQPWRSLWLLQVVARIYIPLVLGAVLARAGAGNFRITVLLSMGLILAASLTRLLRFANSAEFTPVSLALVAGALALLAAQLLLAEPQHRRVTQAAIILGVGLLAVSLSRWDARSSWTRFVEQPAPLPTDLAALLPPKVSVYWEDSTETPWLRLGRADYFSCDQGTGAVFYRATAMTYRHRAKSFWPLRTGDFFQSDACASFNRNEKRARNRAGLERLCRREPGLDKLVLTAPLEGITATTWNAPVHFQDIHMSDGAYFALATDRFYIYSCADVR